MAEGIRAGGAWYELAAEDTRLRADLERAESALRQAGIEGEREFAQPIERGADRAGDAIVNMARSVSGISFQAPDELANSLERAQREADEALVALRSLSAVDLSEEEARRYADAVNEIEAEAKVTASELRELQASQPEFDTPELRQAAQELDRVGDEANEVGNEFRELARANPDATLAKAARESKQLATGMDQAAKKSDGLMTKLRGVHGALLGLGLAIGAQQVLGFFNDAISAASDLGETVSKVGQIFGQEAVGGLQQWASTAATALGQSQQQALDAAATFGIFGKSAGLAGQDLVAFSTEMTELASDLASFNNSTPEEAITAIGAALRGESEPIRRFGVLLDDATLRAKAFELGIISTTKNALTPQQRVLAAHAEILAQTSDAQGDFARTSDQLANQQRIQAARMQDAMARLGEVLLPLALAFTEFASTAIPALIEGLGSLIGMLQPLGAIFAEHADELLPVLIGLLGVKLVSSLKLAEGQTIRTAAAMRGLRAAMLLGLPVIAELGSSASEAFGELAQNAIHGEEAAAAMRELRDAVGGDWAPLIAQQMHDWGVTLEEFQTVVERVGGDTEQAWRLIVQHSGDVGAALESLNTDGTALGVTFGRVAAEIPSAMEEAAQRTEAALSGLSEPMRKRVEEVLATARQIPGGVAVTLEDGSTLVAGSAAELASGIVTAFERADADAQDVAREIPGNIARSILEGRDSVLQAGELLADAAVDPLVAQARIDEIRAAQKEAQKALEDAIREGRPGAVREQRLTLTQLEIELAAHLARQDPNSREAAALLAKYLRSEDPATRAAAEAMLAAVEERQLVAALNAEEYAERNALALPDALAALRQRAVNEQITTTQAVLREAQALEDPMYRSGFTAGDGWASAIGSPANVGTAGRSSSALVAPVKSNLSWNAYSAGYAVGDTWRIGFRDAMVQTAAEAGYRMNIIKGLIGSSLPTDGPLQHPDEGGRSIGEVWGDGLFGALDRVIGQVPTALRRIESVLSQTLANPFINPFQIVAPAAVQTALAPVAAPATFTPAGTIFPTEPVVQEVHNHYHLKVDGFIPAPTTPRDVLREMRRMSVFTTRR